MTITANATRSYSSADISGLSLERIEALIIELASQLAGATCVFLLHVAAFDDAEGWRAWGMRSTADWLSWKCGIGLNAAREQVRVARTMRQFPQLVELFGAGRLSYSKVRSITRGATPETIEMLTDYALVSTAAELERIVAAHRRPSDDEARQAKARRSLTWRRIEDGTLVGSFRIPAEEADGFIEAIQGAKRSLPDPEPEQETALDAAIEACQDCRDAALRMHAGCDGSARAHHRYAHLDVSAETSTCQEVIELVARTECPEVDPRVLEHLAAGRTNADALLHLSRIATASIRAGHADQGRERYLAVVHVSAETSTGHGELDSRIPLAAATTDRVTCSCDYVIQTGDRQGNPLHLGRKTRRIRGKLARVVHRRDGGRCQAPGCERATTEIHHIVHWRHHGETCITNLISLCSSHHWLVHEGGWQITTLMPGAWSFQRADGSPVPVTGAPPIHLQPLPHNDTIAADAITPLWFGPQSIDEAIQALAVRNEARSG